MHLAGDRHVVLDVEGVGVEAAVPPDDVEGVGGVGHHGADDAGAGAVLDQHLDVLPLAQQRLVGAVQVALAVRRVLEQLAVPRQVALGRGHVAAGLDRVEPRRLGRHPAVGGGARDHHVVAGSVGHGPEDRLHHPAAGLDEDALVTHGVAVVRRGLGAGAHVGDPHVVVAQQQPPTGDGVGGGGQVGQPEVAGLEGVVRRARLVGQLPHGAVHDGRRHPPVVEQRGVAGEALLPHQLLVVEPAVGVAVLGVSLARHLAEPSVVGHAPIR